MEKNQQRNKRSKKDGETGKKLYCHGAEREEVGLCILGYGSFVRKFSEVHTEERLCKILEEGRFVVDSGASMHMLSMKDTARVTRRPTTVITAKGSMEAKEEATVYVRDLHLLVVVQLPEDGP